uniref:Uncharacterized protein n=1 Tax=Aegilops tauschii subsp. strangulata TaxID=200361 RepID=A0A453AY18_AEGTS
MHLSENEGIEGVRFAVTGGHGFISAALCLELIRRGALEVCSLDDLTCASPPLGPSSSSTLASASSKGNEGSRWAWLICSSCSYVLSYSLMLSVIPCMCKLYVLLSY